MKQKKTVKQIKKIPTVWSTITSSAIYDADSNHIFRYVRSCEGF